MAKGAFISFEGGEGCGKSTHVKALAEHLKSLGKDCVVTREPGGTPLSEKIRALLLHAKEGSAMTDRAEILLFEAARAQHVEELIKPALEAGKIVVCDRFFDSTTAYQGAARNIPLENVRSLNMFATGGLVPDVTILLDLPASVGMARASARDAGNSDRMGSEKAEFYEAVRSAFLRLASENPNRFVVVDTTRSAGEVFAEILRALSERGVI